MAPVRHLGDAAVVVLLGFFASACLAESFPAKVVGVTDGDTVTVLDAAKVQHKIRLSGIDAPEKSQPFGNASRRHLATLIFGRDVIVETFKRDRYGRELGKIFINGQDANLEQLRVGFAWHYKQYEHEQPVSDRQPYSHAETGARTARLGLWRDLDATPPWEYRKIRRNRHLPGLWHYGYRH